MNICLALAVGVCILGFGAPTASGQKAIAPSVDDLRVITSDRATGEITLFE